MACLETTRRSGTPREHKDTQKKVLTAVVAPVIEDTTVGQVDRDRRSDRRGSDEKESHKDTRDHTSLDFILDCCVL